MRTVVSELSGRGNILHLAERGNVEADPSRAREVLERVKHLESKGYTFEAAEASVEMMLRRTHAEYRAPFKLVDFMVVVEHREGRGLFAEATVKVEVEGRVMHTAAEGNGPVNALSTALRKALEGSHPEINDVHLTDYKVRILDSDEGTAATTRVLIDFQKGTRSWTTVGASANIIEASWIALADALEYAILREREGWDERRPRPPPSGDAAGREGIPWSIPSGLTTRLKGATDRRRRQPEIRRPLPHRHPFRRTPPRSPSSTATCWACRWWEAAAADSPFGASTFLSSRPDQESHEIVIFADARLRHTAFKVETLADLRSRYRDLVARGLPIKMALNHGVSLAFYFDDPDGNMIEIYWPTGLDYGQPYGHPIDLTLPEDALLQDVEQLAARHGIAWRSDR